MIGLVVGGAVALVAVVALMASLAITLVWWDLDQHGPGGGPG